MADHDRASQPAQRAQATLARAREQLLAGRGPGASAVEIARHTRGRTELAGQPTPRRRAQLAHQTALAKGNADALTAQIAATGRDLSGTLTAIKPRATLIRRDVGRYAQTAAVGFALGAGATAVLVLVIATTNADAI